MVKIFGEAMSRAYRCLWLARELNIEFEHVLVDTVVGAKKPEHLAINPNGKVPALIDGPLALWESMAINLYLAKKHGGSLAPQTLDEEARTLQWTFWAVSECEQACTVLMTRRIPRPALNPTPEAQQDAEPQLRRVLPVLDAHLSTRPYLIGDRFTVADLNVASVLSSAKAGGYDFGQTPHLDRWLRECLRRPAQKETVRSIAS